MMNQSQILLRHLVTAAIARQPGAEGTVIANHLQQIEDLLIGQGLDFSPEQDPIGDRTPFVTKLVEQLKVKAYLPDILRKTMGTGEVLLWLRYTPSGYRLRYYAATQFEPYYDPVTDDLYAATVISSYKERTAQGLRVKWLKLVILQQGYFIQRSDRKPQLEGLGQSTDWTPDQAMPTPDQFKAGPDEITFTENPFPFLPIRLIQNKPTGPGQRAADDFTEFASQLIDHDQISAAMHRNVRKFARQTIVTNLRREQILKAKGANLGSFSGAAPSYGDSVAFAADFYTSEEMAAFSASRGGGANNEEVADLIGVDEDQEDYFVDVLDWNPIGSDQLSFVERTEIALHSAMGSSKDRGGNTAFETRANLSWGQATANKKAMAILTDGVCKLLSDALDFETYMFNQSLGLVGLQPAGDTAVRWRRVDLIEASPQEQLQKSILGRNLEEEGVGTREILRILFPSKTDKEIQQLTGGSGGVPFRKIDKVVPKLMELIRTAGDLGPGLGDPLLTVADLLLENLIEAINYGREQPGDDQRPSYTSIANADSSTSGPTGLAALLRAASPGPDAGSGMVSADDQQSIEPGDIPSDGTTAANPITAAFGRFTDPSKSPVWNAVRGLIGTK
jgi:hypothetical protein